MKDNILMAEFLKLKSQVVTERRGSITKYEVRGCWFREDDLKFKHLYDYWLGPVVEKITKGGVRYSLTMSGGTQYVAKFECNGYEFMGVDYSSNGAIYVAALKYINWFNKKL